MELNITEKMVEKWEKKEKRQSEKLSRAENERLPSKISLGKTYH